MILDCSHEFYVDVPGYEGRYQVSNWGNVKSLRHTRIIDIPSKVSKSGKMISGKRTVREVEERILVPELLSTGYYRVTFINEDNTKSRERVHQLVAKVFIENPDPVHKKEVDHIDGDKSNNRADNLRWCTHEENMRYAQDRLGTWNSHVQKVICLDTGDEFDTIADAARWASGDPTVKSSSLRAAMANRKAYYGHVMIRSQDLKSIPDVEAYTKNCLAVYRSNTSSEEKAIMGKKKRNWKSSSNIKSKLFKPILT